MDKLNYLNEDTLTRNECELLNALRKCPTKIIGKVNPSIGEDDLVQGFILTHGKEMKLFLKKLEKENIINYIDDPFYLGNYLTDASKNQLQDSLVFVLTLESFNKLGIECQNVRRKG